MNRSQAEPEPRLQEPDTNDQVAGGTIDPCLVFLEAHDQGFPVLVACWANSSQDIEKPGEPSLLELSHIQLFGWFPNVRQSVSRVGPEGPNPWLYRTGTLEFLQIEGDEPEIRLIGPEETSPFSP